MIQKSVNNKTDRHRETDRETERQRDRETERQPCRQAGRQADRQTEKDGHTGDFIVPCATHGSNKKTNALSFVSVSDLRYFMTYSFTLVNEVNTK